MWSWLIEKEVGAVLELQEIADGPARVVIDVSRGGEIVSFVDERIAGEIFWKPDVQANRSEISAINQNTQAFYDDYRGGVQELFPNTADATKVLGAELPFHGELTATPLNIVAKTSSSLALKAELRRFPIEVTKQISVSDSGSLKIESQVKNLSPRRLPYSWGLHPVFSDYFTGSGSNLVGLFDGVTAHPTSFGASQQFLPGSTVESETGSTGESVLNLVSAESGSADLIYVNLKEPWVRIGRPERLGLEVKWDNKDFNCLWLWQECHDASDWPWWGRHHIVGVEPHTAYPAQSLEAHIEDGKALFLEPYASAKVTFEFDLIEKT
jgi:hypothetical protein